MNKQKSKKQTINDLIKEMICLSKENERLRCAEKLLKAIAKKGNK